jgi:hypothetical protein
MAPVFPDFLRAIMSIQIQNTVQILIPCDYLVLNTKSPYISESHGAAFSVMASLPGVEF